MDRRTAPFQLEDVATDAGSFSGWASVFNRIDSYDSLFSPTCFNGTLADFLAKGFIAGLNHNWDCPIGAPVAAKADPTKGLFVRAELVPTEAGNEARVLLSHRLSTGRPVIQSLSFGFDQLAYRDCQQPAQVRDYWDQVGYTPDVEDLDALTAACARRGVRIIDEVRLYEVSPVTVPGNKWADITEARQTPASDRLATRDRDLHLRLLLANLSV
jgi:phage head maturation protease